MRRLRGMSGSDRAQSETIAVVLLLAMVVMGTTAVVAFGTAALDSSKTTSRTLSVEHTLTQFDSKAAMVALGSTDFQSLDLVDSGLGRYEVRPDAGWVNVTHRNYSAQGHVETILNVSLGAFVYQGNDVTIAYQGGGVWRHANNGSIMLSPPEFHYRESTLTFPIITIAGNGSLSGVGTAEIEILERSLRMYPNASASYEHGSKSYLNPVENGTVIVTIHSRYYQAWGTYFRERTGGEVTEFDNNDTVRVKLVTSKTLGDFDMPSDGNAISVRGLSDGHPIDNFTVTLKASNLNNAHWSLYEESGNEKFEIHIHSPGKCTGTPATYSDQLDVSVFYYNGSGGYHEWQNESVTPTGPYFTVDCDDSTITANLTGGTPLTSGNISLTGGDSKWHFGSIIDDNDASEPLIFDQHDIDNDGTRDGSYSYGDREELGFLVNHYVSLLGPNVDLTVDDGPGGSSRINEDESFGTLDYETSGGGGFLTFLHITENRIEVDID